MAHQRSDEEVARIIGADWLIYQQIDDLKASAWEGNQDVDDFECSAFNGEYVTGDIDEKYLAQVSLARNDQMKQRRDAELNTDANVLELHNHA